MELFEYIPGGNKYSREGVVDMVVQAIAGIKPSTISKKNDPFR